MMTGEIHMRMTALLAGLILVTACTGETERDASATLDPLAESYVKLTLALGEHDPDYVDAYFGPAEWREMAAQNPRSLAEIATQAVTLAQEVRSVQVPADDYLLTLRQDYIASYLESLATVAQMRDGLELSFDEESKRVYGFVAPTYPVEHYAAALDVIDGILPGDEPLHERVYDFDLQFRLEPDDVEAVVRAGIEECKRRTLQHMILPEREAFVLELVEGNPWGAYNWYQGNFQSLIQVEMSQPKPIGTSMTYGCHEGYPGHHAFSSLLDKNFLQDRAWIEFAVLPLYSPQGVIFEGTGDFAERVAFPGDSGDSFLREVILPMTGKEDVDLETRRKLAAAKHELRYAGIEAARKYLDGEWDRSQTEEWLSRYALVPPESMDSWFGFTERYRAYRINYVLGEDLVEAWIQAENPDGDNDGDWAALAKLLSFPPTPMLFAEQ